ncbi:mariner Mos1 transposase [Trichonephila clavipes]|uniref:Mariner Mos1 transposase n=1 Tax=Trichonephila clavipes TaxID=2585209 RepID=A0A8X6VB63_TRICX|nr:mariner Mos1 transposase [Trichonephila clavipes]
MKLKNSTSTQVERSFRKWRSVSFTDAVVHCPDFGSKSKFYRSRPSPHNLWETTRVQYVSLSYGLFNIKQKLIKKKQAALIQQLEEELRMSHLRNPEADIQHLEALYAEKEHMTKEIYLLRETIKKGIIYSKLLLYGQTLNSDIYCQQLDCLKLAIVQKRPELANRRGVAFHQDNARPPTSVVTRQKLWELGWEVLMHPPYSPDLEPSDYHLFLALKDFLSDKKLGSREDCENRLLEFFANKDQGFYERGIMKLPLQWQQITQQNGAYLTQIGLSETF